MSHNVKCSVALNTKEADNYFNTREFRRNSCWAVAAETPHLEASVKIDGKLFTMPAPFIIIATFVEETNEFKTTYTTSLS